MKFIGPLITVKDIKKSIQFYHDILGLDVICDFGANVTLTGGFSLQTLDSWKEFIQKQENEITLGNNAGELYFEEDDMDAFLKKLEGFDIDYIHPLIEHEWGQRGIRFYDLDKHIIEVGENMVMVVKRFIDSGLSVNQTAKRMGVSVDYVKSCLC
jgi:catechol 2,3-dioxygenase-like lactoylglutathione lyase family enzyme